MIERAYTAEPAAHRPAGLSSAAAIIIYQARIKSQRLSTPRRVACRLAILVCPLLKFSYCDRKLKLDLELPVTIPLHTQKLPYSVRSDICNLISF